MDVQLCLICNGHGQTLRMDGDYQFAEDFCQYCGGKGYEILKYIEPKKVSPAFAMKKAIEVVEKHWKRD